MPQPLEVPLSFSRSRIRGDEWELSSAQWQVERMSELLGVADLGDTEILDMGCGVKLTKLFVNRDLPIKRYVGVDVYGEMIAFLRANVSDPRFEFLHMDIENDLYNPGGRPFTDDLRLPLATDDAFDLICLFSVSRTSHRPMPA